MEQRRDAKARCIHTEGYREQERATDEKSRERERERLSREMISDACGFEVQ